MLRCNTSPMQNVPPNRKQNRCKTSPVKKRPPQKKSLQNVPLKRSKSLQNVPPLQSVPQMIGGTFFDTVMVLQRGTFCNPYGGRFATILVRLGGGGHFVTGVVYNDCWRFGGHTDPVHKFDTSLSHILKGLFTNCDIWLFCLGLL